MTITISRPSNGVATVTHPSGETEDVAAATLTARGYDVPKERRELAVFNADGSLSTDLVEVFCADIEKGDKLFIDGVFVEVTEGAVVEGRDATVRLGGFRRHANGGWRRKLGAYNTVKVAKS